MNRRTILLVATCLAAACATSNNDLPGPSSAPPEEPPFPTAPGECVCSEDGRGVICEAGPVSPCADGQRCFEGRCAASACEAAKQKQSAEGCSFYTVVPDVFSGTQGCYAIFLTNASPRPVDVKLRIEGREFDGSNFVYLPKEDGADIRYEKLPNGQIPATGLAIAFIAGPIEVGPEGNYRDCPVEPVIRRQTSSPRSVGSVRAIALETSEPVLASDIYPYGGADSYVTAASALLPVNTWGKDYVAVVPSGGGEERARAYLDLIAVEDTVLTLSPKSTALEGGDVIMPTPVGKSTTLELLRGMALHLVQGGDLTGTILTGDKPFLTISGSRCWGNPCDAAHQQLPSVATLGWEYVAVGHRDRLAAAADVTDECQPAVPEAHSFRLVGVADGTALTYEPAPPPGAPATIDAGRDAWISSANPFVVRSQDENHPFLLTELMSSCTVVDPCGKHGCPGDPEFTASVPSIQFLRDALFFTDPTYPTTHLVVVRRRDDRGAFAAVSLDCMGKLEGWSALGRNYEYTRVDLVTDGVGQHGCANGRHQMTSDATFSATIWGWGSGETSATSYALPASRGLRPVNSVGVK